MAASVSGGSSDVFSNKYKRRNVSAVRDFPVGCGRNAPPVNNSRLNGAPVVAELAEGGDKRDLETMEKETDVVDTGFVNHSESKIEVQSVEVQPVSVNRQSVEVLPVSVNHSESKIEAQSVEVLSSPVRLEMDKALDDLVGREVASSVILDGVEKLCTDVVEPLDPKLLKTVENDELQVSKESHGGQGQALRELEGVALINSVSAGEKKTELEIGALADEAVPVTGTKSWSSPDWPISDGNSSDRPPKNKYCKRRFSAIRDFPPFCGRNAPLPSEEDRRRIMSVNKNLSGIERAGLEHGALEKKVKIDLDGGAVEGMLEADVEGGPVRETVTDSVEKVEESLRNGTQKTKLKGIVPEPTNKSQEVLNGCNAASFSAGKKVKETVGKANGSMRQVGKETVVYFQDKSVNRKPAGNFIGSGNEMDGVIVQGLMAAPYCPWRKGKGVLISSGGGMNRNKIKMPGLTKKEKSQSVTKTGNSEADYSVGKCLNETSVSAGKAAYGCTDALISMDEDDIVANNKEQCEGSPGGQTAHEFNVTLPPFGPKSTSNGDARNRVRETLRLYQAIFRKLLQGEEAHGEAKRGLDTKKKNKRIDLMAADIIKKKKKELNTGKIVGAVPGVEVGDEFQYRVELGIIGVHSPLQGGIDYVKQGGKIVATSIVASGAYADDMDNADRLIYYGQGGNLVGKDKQPEDQKLERGNLSLKNSIHVKNPVRVIRGSKETKASDSSDVRAKMVTTYFYDGLYTVENYWTETGRHGKLVFMFELRRIPGQPELAWKEVKKSKNFKVREGLCVNDISGGKESLPIGAVNKLDNEKPPSFHYITRMIYPDQYIPIPPKGCDCTSRCSDSKNCSCAIRNGGEVPYNHNGAIVEAKALVYECGPSCKCPPSCYNKVSQHGVKLHLEVFKTQSRGWGVRSLTFIPSGSFICEYMGELIEDREADQRILNDEYLFDIGQNYNDCSVMPDAQSTPSEVFDDGGYTIDAARYGNVARFINHSCSPNLYAQNVLYDHEDRRMPHIMLFAAENIPPLQELTYHYNYSVDQIRDSNGNIKMKSCYCGSAECSGRMY